MAAPMEDMGDDEFNISHFEIRKLRKKLRQIEYLEHLSRNLTNDEQQKVNGKATIRSKLRLILPKSKASPIYKAGDEASVQACGLKVKSDASQQQISDWQMEEKQLSTNHKKSQQESCSAQDDPFKLERMPVDSIYTESAERMSVEEHSEPCGDGDGAQPPIKDGDGDGAQPPIKDGDGEKNLALAESSESRRKSNRKTGTGTGKSDRKSGTGESVEKSRSGEERAGRREDALGSRRFIVRSLEGHEDVVTGVRVLGDLVLSCSRDTTVRAWDARTGRELRSMGGHTAAVMGVVALSPEHSTNIWQRRESEPVDDLDDTADAPTEGAVICSCSLDCTLRTWCLDTGRMLREVYVYNPVTCLAYWQQRRLIVIGTDGGKIEVWDVCGTGERVHSMTAGVCALTAMQVEEDRLYAGAANGDIFVWQLGDAAPKPLFRSEDATGDGGAISWQRRVHSLAVRGGAVYYGDDGENVKVVDWKNGAVTKLRNHPSEVGVTYALHASDALLFASGIDLDSGQGYVNVWDLAGERERYRATLQCEDVGRVTCLAAVVRASGRLWLASGGQDLLLWKQTAADDRPDSDDDDDLTATTTYDRHFLKPVVDSDEELSSDDDDDEDAAIAERRDAAAATRWCTVL